MATQSLKFSGFKLLIKDTRRKVSPTNVNSHRIVSIITNLSTDIIHSCYVSTVTFFISDLIVQHVSVT